MTTTTEGSAAKRAEAQPKAHDPPQKDEEEEEEVGQEAVWIDAVIDEDESEVDQDTEEEVVAAQLVIHTGTSTTASTSAVHYTEEESEKCHSEEPMVSVRETGSILSLFSSTSSTSPTHTMQTTQTHTQRTLQTLTQSAKIHPTRTPRRGRSFIRRIMLLRHQQPTEKKDKKMIQQSLKSIVPSQQKQNLSQGQAKPLQTVTKPVQKRQYSTKNSKAIDSTSKNVVLLMDPQHTLVMHQQQRERTEPYPHRPTINDDDANSNRAARLALAQKKVKQARMWLLQATALTTTTTNPATSTTTNTHTQSESTLQEEREAWARAAFAAAVQARLLVENPHQPSPYPSHPHHTVEDHAATSELLVWLQAVSNAGIEAALQATLNRNNNHLTTHTNTNTNANTGTTNTHYPRPLPPEVLAQRRARMYLGQIVDCIGTAVATTTLMPKSSSFHPMPTTTGIPPYPPIPQQQSYPPPPPNGYYGYHTMGGDDMSTLGFDLTYMNADAGGAASGGAAAVTAADLLSVTSLNAILDGHEDATEATLVRPLKEEGEQEEEEEEEGEGEQQPLDEEIEDVMQQRWMAKIQGPSTSSISIRGTKNDSTTTRTLAAATTASSSSPYTAPNSPTPDWSLRGSRGIFKRLGRRRQEHSNPHPQEKKVDDPNPVMPSKSSSSRWSRRFASSSVSHAKSSPATQTTATAVASAPSALPRLFLQEQEQRSSFAINKVTEQEHQPPRPQPERPQYPYDEETEEAHPSEKSSPRIVNMEQRLNAVLEAAALQKDNRNTEEGDGVPIPKGDDRELSKETDIDTANKLKANDPHPPARRMIMDHEIVSSSCPSFWKSYLCLVGQTYPSAAVIEEKKEKGFNDNDSFDQDLSTSSILEEKAAEAAFSSVPWESTTTNIVLLPSSQSQFQSSITQAIEVQLPHQPNEKQTAVIPYDPSGVSVDKYRASTSTTTDSGLYAKSFSSTGKRQSCSHPEKAALSYRDRPIAQSAAVHKGARPTTQKQVNNPLVQSARVPGGVKKRFAPFRFFRRDSSLNPPTSSSSRDHKNLTGSSRDHKNSIRPISKGSSGDTSTTTAAEPIGRMHSKKSKSSTSVSRFSQASLSSTPTKSSSFTKRNASYNSYRRNHLRSKKSKRGKKQDSMLRPLLPPPSQSLKTERKQSLTAERKPLPRTRTQIIPDNAPVSSPLRFYKITVEQRPPSNPVILANLDKATATLAPRPSSFEQVAIVSAIEGNDKILHAGSSSRRNNTFKSERAARDTDDMMRQGTTLTANSTATNDSLVRLIKNQQRRDHWGVDPAARDAIIMPIKQRGIDP